jgi:hypothetical protein
MFYSGRHSEALVKLYSEMFGVPVPESTGRKAAAGGRMQELMAAVDEATRRSEPILDWTAFEVPPPAGEATKALVTPDLAAQTEPEPQAEPVQWKTYEQLTPEEKAGVDALKASGKMPPRGDLILKRSPFGQRVVDYQPGGTHYEAGSTWD